MIENDDLNLIQIELARNNISGSSSSLTQQLESMASASRALETALTREKTYSAQLRKYTGDLIARIHKLQANDKKTHEEAEKSRRELEALKAAHLHASQELSKSQAQLERYRQAWSEVLRREKKAQTALLQAQDAHDRLRRAEELALSAENKFKIEKQNREKIEHHAELHRNELQSMMVRLHTSEARYNDMVKELEALQLIRKSHQIEISKAQEAAKQEADARSRMKQNELLGQIEQERARADQLFLEVEQYKDRLRQESTRRETELAQERQRREAELGHERSRRETEVMQERQRASQWESETKNIAQQLEQSETELRFAIESLEEKNRADVRRFEEELVREREARLVAEKARAKLERDVVAKDRKITLLRNEVSLTQEILMAEKTSLRDFADRLASQAQQLEGEEDRESWNKVAKTLRDASEVKTLTSEVRAPVGNA
jgi:hypothetical protein